jgi:hypothetical protein
MPSPHQLLSTGHWSLISCPLPVCLSLLLTTWGTGCRLVRGVADVPGQAVRTVSPGKQNKEAVDPVEVQQNLLRFADEFSTRMVIGVEKLRRGTNAMAAAEVLRWKIALGNESCAIASGPNAVANLLDMTVFVTVTRAAMEEHWQPKVFGESARPMLESCRNAETNIWRLAGKVLKAEQEAELRRAIEVWRRENPHPEDVLAARAVGFASQVAQASPAETAKPGSVFSLLRVDPLAGMDPAVREIAQTRLFAERALYVTQKMPTLLRWQTELLSANALDMPGVRQLVTNSTQLATAVERFAAVAERLPGQASTEREEILKALEGQERKLTPLVNEVRQTLAGGTQMSTSLNTTLTTLDTLLKRVGVGQTNQAGPPSTNAEPFRIQDYGQTAARLEAAARQLTELLHTLDQTLGSTNLEKLTAQVGPVVEQAKSGGKEIVDYAFWKGVLFVGLVLLAALLYRFLGARLAPALPPKPSRP